MTYTIKVAKIKS